jgi:hypothetical protein
MFFVTGTPRSATGYASKLFSAMEILTSHEVICRPRSTFHDLLGWYKSGKDEGESSWLAWSYLSMLPGPIKVLHTVRNPWTVIDSLAHRNDILQPEASLDRGKMRLREMAQWLCPEIFEHDDAINRAATMVVRWNRLIERAAARSDCPLLRYRVEDICLAEIKRILSWLDIDRDDFEILRGLDETPKDVNAGRRIDHNVEITNPVIKEYLNEACPGVSHVIGRVLGVDRKRSRDEMESAMKPQLKHAVRDIAEEYGYSIEQELENDSCHECKAV